jgi:hypothetical protein
VGAGEDIASLKCLAWSLALQHGSPPPRAEQAEGEAPMAHRRRRRWMTDRILPIALALIATLFLPSVALRASPCTPWSLTEVPQLTPEQLESSATDIVLGVVESRAIDESDGGGYRERRFTFQVRVEETLKGELERGAVIPVTAWTRLWVGPGEQPPGSNGHAPLPLDGELARFFLVAESDGFAVILPNGVELGGGADPSDPVRWGDPPQVVEADTTETTPPTKDPFGWDVMLLLLAAPILIGSFRQRGKARWILLGISTLLMSGAALIVLL